MKRTLRTRNLITTASLAAVALAVAPLAHAQSTPKTDKQVEQKTVQQHQADVNAGRSADTVGIATDDAQLAKTHTAKKLAGEKVRGSDNKDLGSVKDFLVDPHAGTVNYAIVSSGGLAGIGDKLRLVPFAALKESGEKKGTFTLNVDKAQFEQLPLVQEDEFKSGRFTVTDAQRRQLEQLGKKTEATSTSATADLNTTLVRADDITGKDVRSGSADIGKISAIVIDTEAGTATALFEPKSGFLKQQNRKFLLSLSRLDITAEKHAALTTTLTATDFEKSEGIIGATASSSTASNVAASTTAAPPPVSAPAAAGNATAQNETKDTTASATNAASQTAASDQPQHKSTTDMAAMGTTGGAAVKNGTESKLDKTSPANSTANANLASTSGSQDKATTSSATGKQKELTPTGRANADNDKAIAANDQSNKSSTSNASSANSKATTTDMVGAEASKGVADASSQQNAATANQPSTEKKAGDVGSRDQTSSKAAGNVAANAEKPRSDIANSNATPAPAAANDQQLTPTGKNSSDQTPSGDPQLVTVAQNIRKALDEDSALAHADVQIVPENGALVLHGTVSDPTVKNAIEKKAHDKAGGKKIDNQIQLQSK